MDRISWSFDTEIKRLLVEKKGIELMMVQYPNNPQYKEKLIKVEEDIKYHEDAKKKGIGLKPRWL